MSTDTRQACQRCGQRDERLTFYDNKVLRCGACYVEVTLGGQPLVREERSQRTGEDDKE